MKQTFLYILILLTATAAMGAAKKTSVDLPLGESSVRINIYENAGANITFFAPHYNERIARTVAVETSNRNGGRLVEVESTDEKGNAARYLKFQLGGKTYTIDPNRIYTDNGRRCLNLPADATETVKQFAERLLQIILPPDGRTLPSGERFVVAVHNNTDVDAKPETLKDTDLTAAAYVKIFGTHTEMRGAYEAQADGVFLSNTEPDADNFVFLSTTRYLSHFAASGFNVVAQKASARFPTAECTVDDGSLSIYSAQNEIQYICLEADNTTGAFRQKQMFEAVYALLPADNLAVNRTAK